MKFIYRWAAVLVASLAFGAAAFGQAATPTLTFAAENVTGLESVTPKLTWSTSPAATSCTASGDWTGTKAAAGTETLAAIMVSKTYNLTCTWPSGTSVTLAWTAPTTNTNGTALTDLAGYTIHYGNTASNLNQTRQHMFPTSTGTPVPGLTAGEWFFCVRAVNALGAASDCSNTVSKTLTAGSVNKSVGIVVNPKPSPPTNLRVE
jgi:hypothetical protein